MHKKGAFLFLSFAFIVLFGLVGVSANFVCGEVGDATDLASSWSTVHVFYSENSDDVTTCQVSPLGRRYCCDPTEIESVSWEIGKIIHARVFDENSGHYTAPVNLTISGEGYDVFPRMELMPFMSIDSPEEGMYLGKDSFSVNVSTFYDFDSLAYTLFLDDVVVDEGKICSLCDHADFLIDNRGFGTYTLEILGEGIDGPIHQTLDFSHLDFITFERSFSCEGCEVGFVPRNAEVNVTVSVEFSHEVSGVLTEYVPRDWEYVSGGTFSEYSQSHDSINWDVSGTRAEYTYTIISSKDFVPRKYVFSSLFDTYAGNENVVVSSPFPLKFLSLPSSFSDESLELHETHNSFVSDSAPLLLYPDHEIVTEVALFPSQTVGDTSASFLNNPLKIFTSDFSSFTIRTTLDDKVFSHMLLRFRVPREDSFDGLFYYDASQQQWVMLAVHQYSRDDEFLYYEAHVERIGIFALREGRRSLLYG